MTSDGGRTAIIGGGCIGLGIAGALASDTDVRLFEKKTCGKKASWAAAGMLAPVMEAEFGEEALLNLGWESLQLYSDFIDELEAETEIDTGYRTEGTIAVAFDQPGRADLRRKITYLESKDLPVKRLNLDKARELEPNLSSYVTDAIKIPSEAQVNNRKFTQALKKRCINRNVSIHENEPVTQIIYENDRIKQLKTPEGTYEPDRIINCAGAWSSQLKGLRTEDKMPVRPVKGEALSVKLDETPQVEHVLRAPDVYCVPKSDGRLVIGGTMQEQGYNTEVRAGAILDLLHEAYELIPFVYETELLETWAGLRPASRDSLPIIGPSTVTDNLYFATGHYRNGILLTPITVKLISDVILSETVPDRIDPFLPERFQEE